VVSAVGDKEKGKERKGTNSQKRYISPIRGEASPCKQIVTKFCTLGDISNVIICANFGVEKLRDLGYTEGVSLRSLVEMAGHPYSSAQTLEAIFHRNWKIFSVVTIASVEYRYAKYKLKYF